MYAAGLTDIGRVREQNQDRVFCSPEPFGPLPNLFIVADGMGGHNAGEVASMEAINHMTDYLRNYNMPHLVQPDNYLDLLVTAIQIANKAVCRMAATKKQYKGMGTTMTACVVTDEKLILAHVGDSRAYAISPSAITKLTTDHTYVSQMLNSGQITAEEAENHPQRHVITRVLGVEHPPFEVDGLVLPLGDTATVLLCSDGLSNMMDDQKIKEIAECVGFVEHRTRFLIDEANERGGHDNISAILIDVKR